MSLQDETETCNISKLRGIAVAPKGPGGGGGGGYGPACNNLWKGESGEPGGGGWQEQNVRW